MTVRSFLKGFHRWGRENAIRDSVLWWNATKCSTGKQLGHFLDLLAANRNKTPHLILEALGPHVRESETPSTDTLTSWGYITAQVEGRRENEAHRDFGEPLMDHLPIGKQVENPCFRLNKDISILRPHGALCCHGGTCGCSHHINTDIPTEYSSLQYRQNPNAECS